MSLKTGRAEGVAQITIDYNKCNSCGLCAEICRGVPLFMENGKVAIDQTRLFGCIGCGQCAAVCPHECIYIEGRDFSNEDLIELPNKQSCTDYGSLKSLMIARRSTRDYKDKKVETDVINKIIELASTAPMGLPPSDVEILIFDGKDKVKEFADDIIDWMKKIKWFFSPWVLGFMRPFMNKTDYESMKGFLGVILNMFIKKRDEGEDWLFYGAPLAMYFYASPYSDPVDPTINATYAMLAAESLGLGTCMIGTTCFCLKYSKFLQNKYKVPKNHRPGILVLFGYPKFKYKRAIRRRLALVRFI